jgi:hypothetical protein
VFVGYTFEGVFIMAKWQVSNISESIPMRSHDLELQDNSGEWHHFTIIATPTRIVFGGVCNVGFLESGYMEREGFSIDECLQELVADLETYYNDGPRYVSRIVCNECM